MHKLREEFESNQTIEAKYARSLDCLMPLLHNYYTKGKSWKKHDVCRQQVINRNLGLRDISDELWQFALSIIDDAVSKGYLAK